MLLFIQTSRFTIVNVCESLLRLLFFLLLLGGYFVHETFYLIFPCDLLWALVALLELRLNKCFADCGMSLVVIVRRLFVAGKSDNFFGLCQLLGLSTVVRQPVQVAEIAHFLKTLLFGGNDVLPSNYFFILLIFHSFHFFLALFSNDKHFKCMWVLIDLLPISRERLAKI